MPYQKQSTLLQRTKRTFLKPERDRWAHAGLSETAKHIGLPALDVRSRALYENALPRGVLLPRLQPDRPQLNDWMAPHELMRHAWLPGQIMLGKFGDQYLSYLDDRPQITIAGARAGKTSTVLEPNIYLYPGSMLVLDPKGELARIGILRQALGHRVYVLDPFGQSGIASACFNALAELDIESWTLVDDVAAIAQALIVDDGDARSRHWVDNARTLLVGIILLVLTFDEGERHLVTVREVLCLTYAPLVAAIKASKRPAKEGKRDKRFYDDNRLGVETLLRTMGKQTGRFGGVLAAIGNRFLQTPQTERGSFFSTASVQTDYLDSLPMRAISKASDFRLSSLRDGVPTSVFLCLPVGRMQSHSRWLRLIVQMACVVLERMGTYPRDRTPILFMMEEFATLGHMEIMEAASAYFPGFGIKLWAVLQSVSQLKRHYAQGWELFLGNAGLVQCFANGDQTTLNYLAQRLERLAAPFELRTVFARDGFGQLLLMEGRPPAAALRLAHADVELIRRSVAGRSET